MDFSLQEFMLYSLKYFGETNSFGKILIREQQAGGIGNGCRGAVLLGLECEHSSGTEWDLPPINPSPLDGDRV